MELKEIKVNFNEYPEELQSLLCCDKIYDSSSSPEAKVIFLDKDNGYFIKKSAKNSLKNEYLMTQYFHSLGLTSESICYLSTDFDYLVTRKIQGNDCSYHKYLDNPKKLCDTIAENLIKLHNIKQINCPINNHTKKYLELAHENYKNDRYDKSQFPDSFGYKSSEDAIKVINSNENLLKNDTLIHGDYCLPNIILNDWKFSGFIDLGNGGIGDKHVDIFWAIWTLQFNLKTNKYAKRFIDAYGKDKIDYDILKLVAAIEVFG